MEKASDLRASSAPQQSRCLQPGGHDWRCKQINNQRQSIAASLVALILAGPALAAPTALSETWCRSPQAAQDVLAQAKRDHMLRSPPDKATFLAHERIQGVDACSFDLTSRRDHGGVFEVTRTAARGRSRGGISPKLHFRIDGHGLPLAFALTGAGATNLLPYRNGLTARRSPAGWSWQTAIMTRSAALASADAQGMTGHPYRIDHGVHPGLSGTGRPTDPDQMRPRRSVVGSSLRMLVS